MTMHPSDPWHILSDALSALRSDIEDGWKPWMAYDSDPADDPKATAEGYEDVLIAAQKLVTTMLEAVPSTKSAALLTVDHQNNLTLHFGEAQLELRYENELVYGYYTGPSREYGAGRWHHSLIIEAAAEGADVTEIEIADYTSWLTCNRLQWVHVDQLSDRDASIQMVLEFLEQDGLVEFRNNQYSRVGRWVFNNDGNGATGYPTLAAAIEACS